MKPHLSIGLFIGSIAVFAVFAASSHARADDWPQWRGPNRDGVSKETGLLKQWPDGGPKLTWTIDGLGGGYSTPSVAAGKIYVVGTLDSKKDEYLIALDEKTGNQIWSIKIGRTAGGKAGPRSTPTVDGDLVYVISSDGNIACVENGKGKWRKSFKSDFGGTWGSWAYAESPLVDGDTLVCTPGGAEATMVGLDKNTGAVQWKAALPASLRGVARKKNRKYHTAGYSSAIAVSISDIRQYVQFVDGGVISVSAEDGAFLWNYNEPANMTANCSTPIVRDGAVLAASAYGNGGGRATVSVSGDKWSTKQDYFIKSLQNHHGGMVLVGDYVYGTGGGSVMCINYKTGEVVWNEKSVGKGSITCADGHLYVRSQKGPIALIEASPKYTPKGRFDQPHRSSESAWPYPVVANGKLYIRDWDKLLCFDVKQ